MSLIAGRPRKNLGCSFVLAWRRTAPKPRVSGPLRFHQHVHASQACSHVSTRHRTNNRLSMSLGRFEVHVRTAHAVGQGALNRK